jgi:hypothetical protein
MQQIMSDTKAAFVRGQRPSANVWRTKVRLDKLLRGGVGLVAMMALLLCMPEVHAQTTAALSGRVLDGSHAEVPGAKVTIVNQATSDKISSVTAADGTYSFPVLLPGVYTILVEAKGFKAFKDQGMTVYAGSRASAPDSVLTIGSVSDTVTVVTNEQILLTDNGSLGATLDAKDIEQLALVSRNADDLVRSLPGVTSVPNGTSNGLPTSDVEMDVETSAAGSEISVNGAPFHGGVSILYDGADINDPGCNCATIAAVDPSMVQEVTVLTSSYGADVAHGPEIISNISKSGSNQYHGEGYFYAKNDALNSNSWLNNYNGVAKAGAHYYDPGGNIGGPVPFTHDRLLFWFGYEKFIQNTGGASTLSSYIPSPDMLAGNFTASAANSALCPNGFSSTNTGTYCNNLQGTVLPDGSIIGVSPNRPVGMIPSEFLSSAAAVDGAALAKVWPAPNETPSAENSYSNFFTAIPGVNDGYIFRYRVDYNFSERTKAYVTYQYGTESSPADGNGAHIYWSPANAIPFPGGGLVSSEKTYIYSGHFIHIFGNTLTNEVIGTLAKAHNATSEPKPSALYKSTLGYTGSTIFNTNDLDIPSYSSAGSQTFPDLSQQDIFTNGAYNLIKPQPSLADNLVKVWGNHTLKLGAFYEMTDNNQGGFNTPNGTLGFGTGGNVNNNAVSGTPQGSPNNPLANFILGNATSYSESSSNPTQDLAYKVISAYADDSWKVRKRLSVEYGLRFDHMGRWYDRGDAGIPVFLPALVAANFSEGVVDPGLQYHAINSAVPKSGINSTFLLLSPRFGMSYDVFGNGKTQVRGGIGVYRFGDNWGDYSGGLSVAQSVDNYNLPSGYSVQLNQIGTTPSPALTPAGAGSGTIESAVNPDDHGNPTQYSYNFSISQRVPFNSVVEISYVGNQAKNILVGGGSDATITAGTGLTNVNKVPLGAFFKPDPVTGITAQNPENVTENLNGTPSGNQYADYYTYGKEYGTNGVYVMSHTGYSNYNGLQISWVKRGAHLTYNVNYTHSKTLGTDLNESAFSLRGNYGVEITDRPNVFNTSLSYNDLNAYHGSNWLISGVVNNWMISTITTYQSGGNLQALSSSNFSFSNTYTGTIPAGVGTALSEATYFGTNAGNTIQPTLTCNPKAGRGANQYLTDKCFAVPAIGSNGPRNYPYIEGPAYFDSDLALAKTFRVTGRQSVTFRASAYDWLNHPLNAFSGQQLNLYYTTDYTSKVSTLSTQTVPNFGTTVQKAGADTRRIMELSLKYDF